MLTEGRRAPAFRLPAHDGTLVRLTDLRGRWVVLFFCPLLRSHASARMARDFRDSLAGFRRERAQVLGIGADGPEALREFARANGLAYPLLVDRGWRTARSYGVWREKRANGYAYMGLVRSTILLDPSGRVERIFDNQRAKGHASKVLRALRRARAAE